MADARPNIAIVVLAAGRSKRMGGVDKLLLPLRQTTLLRDRVETALATGCETLVILPTKASSMARWDTVSNTRAKLIACPNSDAGMGESLACAVQNQKPSTDGMLVLLADLPELEASDLIKVMQSFHPIFPARGTSDQGKAGHPVLFPRRLFSRLMQLTGDQGARTILSDEDVQHVSLAGERAVFDIDSPSDWQSFRDQQSTSSMKKGS